MNVYEIVTRKIIEEYENGNITPWRRPWTARGLPCNFVTKKTYRGLNCFLLQLNNFREPYYMTFNQIQQLNGSIKSGAESQIVIYWKWLESKTEMDDKGKPKSYPLLRYYRVFNIEQVSGIEYQSAVRQLTEFEKIDNCERVVDGYKTRPVMVNDKQRAYYHPVDDYINMPIRESFKSPEEYYSTLFHELIHSTGHKSRLNREEVTTMSPYASPEYSKEELVAEMGAAYLCAATGISNRTLANSAAYIRTWLARLKKDSRILFQAASQAQKAADYILNLTTEENQTEEN